MKIRSQNENQKSDWKSKIRMKSLIRIKIENQNENRKSE